MKEKPVVVRVELPFVARLYLWGQFIKWVAKYTIVALAVVGIAAFFILASQPDESKPQFMLDLKQYIIKHQPRVPTGEQRLRELDERLKAPPAPEPPIVTNKPVD